MAITSTIHATQSVRKSGAFYLSSRAFGPFQELPLRFTAEGANLPPPLYWGNAPLGTREFVLICEDSDASAPVPFIHWIVYRLPSNPTQGRNSLGKLGYSGPKPPSWHRAHHYFFRLYALDTPLDLPPGADFEAVIQSMRGHVLGEATLVTYYERQLHRRLRELGEALESEEMQRSRRRWAPWAALMAGGLGAAGWMAWRSGRLYKSRRAG